MTAVGVPSVLRWTAAGLYHTGMIRPLSMVLGYAGRTQAFQVLTYHRVNNDRDPFFPAVNTDVFEPRMAYIARTYQVLTVEELTERMGRGILPRNALAITFDDGYRDNLTHAAPILARYGLPATIFLTTGFIGTATALWYDRLAMAFKLTKALSFDTPWGETVSLASQDDRLRALEQTLVHLKRLPDDDLRRTLDGLLEVLDVTDQQDFKNLMLSWDDVHALAKLGFSIGAHTVNHPILSRISAQRAWREILDSRTMIEAVGFHHPRAFAYPNGGPGDYTETVKNLVREAGFTCAVTTRFGINTRETDLYELQRGGPWEEHLPTYALKLAWYRQATS
jgi:peptidoglycan/xylan/chitin deacetylase (PgdA/CDA1 family)